MRNSVSTFWLNAKDRRSKTVARQKWKRTVRNDFCLVDFYGQLNVPYGAPATCWSDILIDIVCLINDNFVMGSRPLGIRRDHTTADEDVGPF